jgi:hypothetical protein
MTVGGQVDDDLKMVDFLSSNDAFLKKMIPRRPPG